MNRLSAYSHGTTRVRHAAGVMVLAIAAWVVGSGAAVGADPAAAAELNVMTEPADATVQLDGETRGKSPLHIQVTRPGTHLLSISKRGYREVRQSLEVGMGQKLPVDLKLEPLLGLALIQSEPAGAEVKIDGVDRGKTPLLITDLPLGQYRVQLQAAGYLPRELDLKLGDRTPVKLETSLVPDSATVDVSSTPAGAEVVFNGIIQGTTPCRIERIPEGVGDISITLAGYAPYSQQLRLAANQSERVAVQLRPLPASLKIVSIPLAARIYVDGKFRGEAPVDVEDLAPGAHDIRADLEGHESVTRTVSLSRAEEAVEEIRLVPNVGVFQLTTEPAGVRVFIDGKSRGMTTAKPDESDLVSEALTIAMLRPGAHDVMLTKKGYFSDEVTIIVERDQTATKHLKLSRRFIPDCEVRTATEVYTGVLVQIDPVGNVKLEVRPGIVRSIPAAEIRSRRALRLEDLQLEDRPETEPGDEDDG